MRFSTFALTILFTLILLAVAKVLPDHGWTPEAARLFGLWVIMFFLTLFVMGVTRIGMQFFGPAVCHGSRVATQDHPPRVALTFDDGPDPASTPALLELLAAHDIQATFFCVGEAVRKNPELARKIIEQGHLVENHTDTHHWSVNFALNARWRRELQGANEAIEEATGTRPRFMRPPLGLTNPHLHQALRKFDLTLIGWDVRSFDTLGKPASKVIDRVVSRTRPGSIILLHDGGQDATRVCEIAQGVIESLKNKGFSFARVSEIL